MPRERWQFAATEGGQRFLLHPSLPYLTNGPNVRLLFGSVFALAIAAAIGLGVTWMALTRGSAYGGVNIGAWTGWPKNGTLGIDPYARATVARTGELPVGSGDGVAFYARTDDVGQPLDGRCDVLLSGTTPQARFWTITLYDPEGRLVANSAQRQGFTSQEIIRNADGSFNIMVGRARGRVTGSQPAAWKSISSFCGSMIHRSAWRRAPDRRRRCPRSARRLACDSLGAMAVGRAV